MDDLPASWLVLELDWEELDPLGQKRFKSVGSSWAVLVAQDLQIKAFLLISWHGGFGAREGKKAREGKQIDLRPSTIPMQIFKFSNFEILNFLNFQIPKFWNFEFFKFSNLEF